MTALHPSNPYYKFSRQQTADALDTWPPTFEQAQSAPTESPRSASIATTTPFQPATASESPSQQRRPSDSRASFQAAPRYRTRSIGGPFGSIYFEHYIDTSPPNDDEIIIATVRVTDSFRRASIEGTTDLPARPPKRGFVRRLSTRMGSPTDHFRYTALKMPRRDYKKYFARDRDGNYAGTEPEREWSDLELHSRFGRYQDMPLRSIPGEQECDDGEKDAAVESNAERSVPAPGFTGSATTNPEGDIAQIRIWNGWHEDVAGQQTSLI